MVSGMRNVGNICSGKVPLLCRGVNELPIVQLSSSA